MGNAKFWYYPNPGGGVQTIDMGEGLAELYCDWEVDAESAVDMSGGSHRTVGMMREIVTIERDRMLLGEELANKFVALQNHLDRGYSVAFCSDSDLAYCAPVSNPPEAGSTQIDVLNDVFASLTGIGSMPANDSYMTLETQPPGMVQEIIKATSTASATLTSGGSIGVSAGTAFGFSGPTFLRYYRFWPTLKRPASDAGRNIVTNEHGQLYSLSLRLVVDYERLFSFHPQSDLLIDWSLQEAGDILTGNDLLGPGRVTLDTQRPTNRSLLGEGPTSILWSPDGRGR